jgi:hypothetical protein
MKRGCLLMGFLLLVFLSLVQAACVQSYGSKAHSESNSLSRSDFAEKSEVRVDTLDVRPAMTRTSLDVRATLSEGSMKLVLTDPKGMVQWEDEIVAPARYNQILEHELIEGEWTLEIALQGATGSYDIQWKGSN